jgi:hypothetical protein
MVIGPAHHLALLMSLRAATTALITALATPAARLQIRARAFRAANAGPWHLAGACKKAQADMLAQQHGPWSRS